MTTVTAPPSQVGQLLAKQQKRAVEAYGLEIAREFLTRAMDHAVLISAYRGGKYRASHRVALNQPKGAGLGDLPSYGIPGGFEVDAGLAGFELGDVAFLGNDATDDDSGHVYALNVESEGWGATPPYEVYSKTMRHVVSDWDGILRAAVRQVSR